MTSTEWRDDYQRIVHNRAIAYAQSGGSVRLEMPFENAHGNGGLLTTVGDLLRWNRNFTEMKVGGPAFVQAQIQQGRLNDGTTVSYASGLFVTSHKGLHEVSHSGATAGYRAWLGRFPDQGLSVAVLCNTTALKGDLPYAVADVYLASVLPKHPNDSVRVDPAVLQQDAGLYRSVRDHTTRSIDFRDGDLVTTGGAVLKASSPNSFVVAENSVMEFKPDGSEKTGGMRIVSELGIDSYEKVERANPSRADLEAMIGEYTSDEAETTLKVALEQNGLVIHQRPDRTIPLTPTYRDGFSCSLGSVRFIRDSGGRVIEMSIGGSRVWDLRLPRAQPANR